MTTPRFIQIHTVGFYPVEFLEWDYTGLTEWMSYGDAVRKLASFDWLMQNLLEAEGEFSMRSMEGVALRQLEGIEEAIYLADAFTVQEEEIDHFAAVEDIHRHNRGEDVANTYNTEPTGGWFYGYVGINVPELVSRIEGCAAGDWQAADRGLASQIVGNLLHLIATIPSITDSGAAARPHADLILVEAGDLEPRSLADVFLHQTLSSLAEAATSISEWLEEVEATTGRGEVRRMMSDEEGDISGAERLSLDDLAAWVARVVRDGDTGS